MMKSKLLLGAVMASCLPYLSAGPPLAPQPTLKQSNPEHDQERLRNAQAKRERRAAKLKENLI